MQENSGQLLLPYYDWTKSLPGYEYAVLVTSLSDLHAKRSKIRQSLSLIRSFLTSVKYYARQSLSNLEKWILILSAIFRNFLKGRLLQVPIRV